MALGKLSGASLSRDFTASIVVFLVALPLCMGIAIASGVPPERGLVTGIVGGIIVGAISGSPLQVSGPAAGLAVIVYGLVQQYGLAGIGPVLAVAGVIQLLAGVLKLGQWFRAISPAVVHGMLAGIGVLIVAGQFHVLMDHTTLPHGLENLMHIPERLSGLSPTDFGQNEAAFAIGLTTIAVMLGWEKLRPAKLKLIPGALLGVIAGTALSFLMVVTVKRVEVPASLLSAIQLPTVDGFTNMLANPTMIVSAVALAFIASAETLLSAAAVDKMQDGVRAKFNQELSAQGVGNFICGILGALPMTGVIVRSSANVQAGAQTRASTIMHGFWLLALVAFAAALLRQIPLSALAGVLVVTGWRLVNLKDLKHLFKSYGLVPALTYVATFTTVVAVDLLAGVLIGLAFAALELIPHLKNPKSLRLRTAPATGDDGHTIDLAGKATFLSLPKLSQSLETAPDNGVVKLKVDDLQHVDHTSIELIRDWIQRKTRAGAKVLVEPAGGSMAHAFAEQH
jgi:MFS superfamily sulfate permease-like transporter